MTKIQFDDGLTANISRWQWACDSAVIARLRQATIATSNEYLTVPSR